MKFVQSVVENINYLIIMLIRKKYTIAIFPFRNVVYLSTPKNRLINRLQWSATCGIDIWDCSYRDVIHNLKILKDKGYEIYKRK